MIFHFFIHLLLNIFEIHFFFNFLFKFYKAFPFLKRMQQHVPKYEFYFKVLDFCSFAAFMQSSYFISYTMKAYFLLS